MPTPSLEEFHDTSWIKIWICIGIIGVLCFSVISSFTQSISISEQRRFVGCANRERTDCNASFFWLIRGLSLENSSANPVAGLPVTPTTTQLVNERFSRSSDEAPLIEAVRPLGMTYESGWYHAKSGTRIQVTALVKNTKSVSYSYVSQVRNVDGEPEDINFGIMANTRGEIYGGSFVIGRNWQGFLTVVAKNKKGTATLTLPIASEE